MSQENVEIVRAVFETSNGVPGSNPGVGLRKTPLRRSSKRGSRGRLRGTLRT